MSLKIIQQRMKPSKGLKDEIKALNEELEDVKKRLHELEDVGAWTT